jgi:hypothetical protein
MLVKYKQYSFSKGAIIVYEDDSIEFIPNNFNNTDLDFDNSEWLECVDCDFAEFEDEIDSKEFFDSLGKEK